jgi:hypothetical protein
MFTVIRTQAGTIHPNGSKCGSNRVGLFVNGSGIMLNITREEAFKIITKERQFATEFPRCNPSPKRIVYS